MSLKRAGAIALRQFYLYRGSPARILPMFAWVAIDVILWGFITRYLNSVASAGFNFVPAMLGAVLLWDFLARVLQGVSTAALETGLKNFLQPPHEFHARAGRVIRALPFADFWQGRVGFAVGANAPEPFAMHAVNQMPLDVIPHTQRST